MGIYPELDLGSDHRMIHNGVGDYDLICPTLGRVGFVPYFMARLTTVGKLCDCGYAVTKVEEVTP